MKQTLVTIVMAAVLVSSILSGCSISTISTDNSGVTNTTVVSREDTTSAAKAALVVIDKRGFMYNNTFFQY